MPFYILLFLYLAPVCLALYWLTKLVVWIIKKVFQYIGNARPMIVFDTFRRYLEYKGYDVNYVSNFTDVDDKIIKKANEEGVDASVISERYIHQIPAMSLSG